MTDCSYVLKTLMIPIFITFVHTQLADKCQLITIGVLVVVLIVVVIFFFIPFS